MAFMTRGFAGVEAEIARSLLDVDAQAPPPPPASAGFWARVRALFGRGFWRAQAYLWLRWLIGFPVAVAFVALLGAALGMIFAPFWVPFVNGGAHLGSWHLHTFAQSLILIPVGLVLLPLTLALAHPVGAAFRPMAAGLLGDPARGTAPRLGGPTPAVAAPAGGVPARPHRRGLELHAIVDASVVAILAVIWAVTSAGYFWPIWVALPLAAALAIHAWSSSWPNVRELARTFAATSGSRKHRGRPSSAAFFTATIWAITSHGYFWPVWPIARDRDRRRGRTSSPCCSARHMAPRWRADRDARDDARRSGRRPGERAAPDRARPARRRPGAAGVARDEPRDGRAEACGRSRAGGRAARRGARRRRARAARAPRPRARDPSTGARRPRARGGAERAGRARPR